MGDVITQIRGRAFETLSRAFQTIGLTSFKPSKAWPSVLKA